MKIILTSGQTVEVSGQYKIKKANGSLSTNEVTLVSGKKAPPTPKRGQKMVFIDKTCHKH